MNYYADKHRSSFGWVYYVVDEDGAVVWLYLDPESNPSIEENALKGRFENLKWDKNRCSHVTRQVDEYFNNRREVFDLKYKLHGTPFQVRVWNALAKIPYGETVSYGDIARGIENPKAGRAIGQANHNNPIMIVIPCHRCIGSDGKVKGSKGAISVREQLLRHEGAKGVRAF